MPAATVIETTVRHNCIHSSVTAMPTQNNDHLEEGHLHLEEGHLHLEEGHLLLPRDKDCRLVHLLSHSGSAAARNTTTDYLHGDYNVTIQPVEILLIILLLVFWASTIAVFLRRWRSIRILQPGEPRFKHAPKNLESIKVVTKHRESVIYNNYSENITKTMQARQKRLDRMNTMPNIKLGEILSAVNPIDETRRCVSIDMEPLHQNGSSSSVKDKARDATNLTRGNSCVQSLAQSCTSIVVSFHSNTVISPVIEVEEEENEEVFSEDSSGAVPLMRDTREHVPSRSEARESTTSVPHFIEIPVLVPDAQESNVPVLIELGSVESVSIDEERSRRQTETLPCVATCETLSMEPNTVLSDLTL